MGIGDRRDHAIGHRLLRHAQLRVHARNHHVELGEQRFVLVEGAVGQDVDLDPGEDPERRQLLVEPGDELQLRFQSLGVEPVRDGERRRMIGEREITVAELHALARHLLDGGAAVGPVGVQVEITLERGPDGRARAGIGRGLGFEPGQILRHFPGKGLRDDAGRARPDPGKVLEPAPVGERPELLRRTAPQRVGGPTERLLLVAARAFTFEQRRDAIECLHRIHLLKVPGQEIA